MLLRAADDGGKSGADPFDEQAPRRLDLERECGVDDIGGSQPVVDPAPLRPEPLGDRVHERGRVVVGNALDLGDALLSIVQMPPGVPVACVGVDNARNAAVLAARILAA